jgi:signal transduction histidine kinase
VAHEINNPLAFVMNNLYLLQRDLQGMTELVALYETCHEVLANHDPALLGRILEVRERTDLGFILEGLDDMMDRTAHGLKRIHQIVAGLRNFARLDEAELKEADVNEGIVSTVNIMRLKARERGIRLELDLKPLPLLLCYSGKVNQVVLNLVANAIDASAQGGAVTVRTSAAADGVEIHVVDEGAGIDPSIRDRIFDPFFTTKAVGKGTGLGLSIGSSIVAAHGGRIGVESRPGEGSQFKVWLPFQSPLARS